jgi:transcriptional regulator with XRE-family HTH domain
MKSSRALPALPLSVRRALQKLGADLSAARRRRRLTMVLLAERAFVSRVTLARVERGDPGVSMGIYASVLFVLGLGDRLGDLADPRFDKVGAALEHEKLPRRVRMPKPKTEAGERGGP